MRQFDQGLSVFRKFLGLAVVGLLIGLAQPAAAATTSYAFTGTVTSGWAFGAMPDLVGQDFSGVITLSDTGTGGSAWGVGLYAVPGTQVSVTYGGNDFQAGGTAATLVVNSFWDSYSSTFTDTTPAFNGSTLGLTAAVALTLLDTSGNMLTSGALALPNVVASAIKVLDVAFFDRYGQVAKYHGTLDSFAAVPLPAGLPLLAAGVGVLGLVGWRKRRVAAPAHA